MKESIRIVLLEDNTDDVRFLEAELSKFYDVTLVNVQTEEAYRDAVLSFKPDIIISDYLLPHFNGMEALMIRNELHPYLPFILLTGSMNEETAVTVMKAGADDYVIKEHLNRLQPAIDAAREKSTTRLEKNILEKALTESEEKYRIIIDHSPEGIIVHAEGKILFANPKAIALAGTDSFEQLKQIPVIRFVHPDYVGISLQRIRKILETHQPSGFIEEKFINIHQQVIDVEVNGIPIQFEGKPAVQTIIRDITHRKQVEASLAHISKLQDIILRLATEFVNIPLEQLDEQINLTLAQVGDFIKVDRSYLFSYNFTRGIMINTHEWCAPGVSAEIQNLQEVPVDFIPDWVEQHVNGNVMHVPDVSALPADSNLRKILEPQSIITLITLPLMSKGNCLGFVGFDAVKEKREWTDLELSLLRVLAELLSNAWQRKRAELIQQIQYNIADAVVAAKTLNELFETVRNELGQLIDSTNFFIAFYNEKDKTLFAPFEKDENEVVEEAWPAEKSLTGRVISQKKSILLTKKEIQQLADRGEIDVIGARAEVWLGVPLEIDNRVFGAIVVQSYNNPKAYDSESVEVLEIIANQLSIYIEQKRRQEDAVKLSKGIEQSPISIIITDPKGIIEYVNPKFCELTGYTPDEAIGLNPNILKSGKQDNDFYKNLWETVLSGKDWQGELHNKKKDGSLYWENASISPVFDDAGQITHFIAVKEDVTEKKEIVRELLIAKEKAEESDRLKSSFLANMSHELRTPMTGILGFSEILCELGTTEEQVRIAGYVLTSAQRLLETLNLILDLSKLEAEQADLSVNTVDLVQLLQTIIETYRPAALKKKLSLVLDTKLETLVTLTNERMISSIFHNLLNNAVKFTSKGGISLIAELETKGAGHELICKVIDTGMGIAEEHYETIFDEFRQVSEGFSRHFEGTGLGLSITRRFVEKLNGKISVQPTQGGGTTFIVQLPVKILQPLAENAQVNPEEKQAAAPVAADGLTRKKVLMVEDEKLSQELVGIFLKNTCILDFANDGDEAIRKCKVQRYDAVFMDISLGSGIDGIDVLKVLNKETDYQTVPIIAVTAYAMKGDKERFLSLGFSDYLAKPYTRKEVTDMLNTLLFHTGSR